MATSLLRYLITLLCRWGPKWRNGVNGAVLKLKNKRPSPTKHQVIKPSLRSWNFLQEHSSWKISTFLIIAIITYVSYQEKIHNFSPNIQNPIIAGFRLHVKGFLVQITCTSGQNEWQCEWCEDIKYDYVSADPWMNLCGVIEICRMMKDTTMKVFLPLHSLWTSRWASCQCSCLEKKKEKKEKAFGTNMRQHLASLRSVAQG